MNYLANYIVIPAAVILDPKTYIIYMYSIYIRCKERIYTAKYIDMIEIYETKCVEYF